MRLYIIICCLLGVVCIIRPTHTIQHEDLDVSYCLANQILDQVGTYLNGSQEVEHPTTTTKECMDKPLMTCKSGGRLGNQMIYYAFLYAVAKRNERIGIMSPDLSIHLKKYFKVSMSSLTLNVYNSIPWMEREIHRHGRTESFLNSTKNISRSIPFIKFKGSIPVAWKLFEDYHQEIVHEFQFLDNILSQARKDIENSKSEFYGEDRKNVVTVGVHVRRGDYVSLARKKKVKLPTMEYYSGGMEYFQKKYKNVVFIIASDDMEWCVSNFSGLKDKFKISYLNGIERSPGVDMAVLANCDHVIFGFGTFGFMSGYLNRGEIVFCTDCYYPKVNLVTYSDNSYANLGTFAQWKGFMNDGKLSSDGY